MRQGWENLSTVTHPPCLLLPPKHPVTAVEPPLVKVPEGTSFAFTEDDLYGDLLADAGGGGGVLLQTQLAEASRRSLGCAVIHALPPQCCTGGGLLARESCWAEALQCYLAARCLESPDL